ncbi:MAG: COQ9 family protein [Rhodospirillales bacterium]|jgi:ubiquinone biosynthesis protein COQ9|nr:COQ9 family protein [Rhodospirillales bacterium]MDP6774195.1 COQ9 family protein [Rhodospirillales bacterium]
MDLGETRDRIIVAALAHVPFDGWTRRALAAGAADAGLAPEWTRRAFPGGVIEAVEHFAEYTDRRMLAALEGRDLGALRVGERIAAAVRTRLELNAPHREAIRRLLSYLALPHNAGLAMRATYRTVDAIWRAAGDEATDFNFYTKRGLLAAVYGTTVLYWLADGSEDQADTWAFLERRLADVMAVPRLQARLKEKLGSLPSPLAPRRRRGRGGRRAPSAPRPT